MSIETSEFDLQQSPRDLDFHDDGRTPLALAAGLVAALVAGGLWAGLVFVTNMEIGYAAWGVGLLVGVAMSRVTKQRTQQLAYAAAALAIVGLIAGKVFIFAGSAGSIAEELEASDENMTASVAWQMYNARELDEATLAEVDAVADGAPVPDATWTAMNEQAAARLATLTPDEKHRLALDASRNLMQSMGMVGGIRAQLSLFDLLWVFFAVGTAFRMMAPQKHEAAEPAVTV